MWIKLKKSFTLVEVLVALAVSSIAITAAYSSYEMIANQYAKNTDLSDIHATGRSIMAIIKRDIRMAGFEYRDDNGVKVNGGIPNPLVIKDSGNVCCNTVEIIYDYYDEYSKKLERRKISYYTKPYSNNRGSRNRLYKKVDILDKSNSVTRAGSEQPMADFIDEFKFVNGSSEKLLFTGDVYYGSSSNNSGTGKIHIFSSDTGYKESFTPQYKPLGDPMKLGPDGNIYYLAMDPEYTGSWRRAAIAILDPKSKKNVGYLNARTIGSPCPNTGLSEFEWVGNELYINHNCSSRNFHKLNSANKIVKSWPWDQKLFHLTNVNFSWNSANEVCVTTGLRCYKCPSRPAPGNVVSSCGPVKNVTMGGARWGTLTDDGMWYGYPYSKGGNIAIVDTKLNKLVKKLPVPSGYATKGMAVVNDNHKSALVEVDFSIRTKNKYGSSGQYIKEKFSSDVLARNIAL